jgi:hypothetical protein
MLVKNESKADEGKSCSVISLQNLSTNVLGDDGYRRSTRNNAQEIIPSTYNASTVFLDKFLQRDAHLFFNNTGIVDMTTNAIEFCPRIPFSSKAGEPARATPADGRCNCYSFNIGNGSRAPKQPNISGERGLQTRFSLLPFYTLDESRFFPANVGSSATVYINVE